MRHLVMLWVLALPSVLFCSNVFAATPAITGKPVCAHYDETAAASRRNDTPPAATAATSTRVDAGAATAPSLLRSGGGSSDLRPHDAPRWQAFLPGMFR